MPSITRAHGQRWWPWVARQRPFILLVVVVGLAVTLPNLRAKTVDGAAGTVQAPAAAGSGAGIAGPNARGATAPGAVPITSAPVGSGPTPTGLATGPASVAAGATYPGVGTAAALSNPQCDPKTGRIRFPSVYAPACVAPWPAGADNGGATAQGVTRTSINIVLYEGPSPTPPATRASLEKQATETLDAFADHYELWGRTLNIHFVPYSGTDEASQRADAIQVADQIEPFLASSYLLIGSTTPTVWATELAARGVISWDETVPFADAHAQPGYRWGYDPDDRLTAISLGDYIGRRLAGRPAIFAGDASLKTSTRKFGVVYDQSFDYATLASTLAGYAVKPADALAFDSSEDPATLEQVAATQVERLKSDGVNNIVIIAGAVYSGLLSRAAAQQDYYPEWTLSGYNLQDTAVLTRAAMDPKEWAHAFGIGLVPPLESPISISERSEIIEWADGHQPADDVTNGQIYLLARDIMAGIQLAGPDLTPATFKQALFTMQPAGGRWCGCVTHDGLSFGRHLPEYPWDKYFDTDDFTEKWWDPNTVGQDEIGVTGPGVYQVVDGGKRYSPDDWPTTSPDVFNPADSVVSYSTEPPHDQTPTYPRPG